MQDVVAGVAGDLVVARRGNEHPSLDIGQAPHHCVGELDVFERVAVDAHAVAVEVAVDRDLIGRAVDLENQVVAHAAGGHVAAQHPGLELQHVALADVGVGRTVDACVVRDSVLPVAPAEQIGVAAVATHQMVVARAAVEHVVVAQPAAAVPASAAVQVVIASTAHQGVCADPAGQVVYTVAAVQTVVACVPVQGVITRIPPHQIIASATAKRVAIGIAEPDVSPGRPGDCRAQVNVHFCQSDPQR